MAFFSSQIDPNKMKEVKYQKLRCTVDSAVSAPTTQTFQIQLDSQFDRCEGVQLHEISDGSIANNDYGMGIKDQNEVFHDVVHHESYDGTYAEPNKKYKDLSMKITSGNKTIVSVYVPTALSTDLIIEVEFKIVRDLVQV